MGTLGLLGGTWLGAARQMLADLREYLFDKDFSQVGAKWQALYVFSVISLRVIFVSLCIALIAIYLFIVAPAQVIYYLAIWIFKYDSLLSSLVVGLILIVSFFIWATYNIPDFWVWVGFILIGILIASFLSSATWIVVWWWD